jgi:carboxylesterase type B
VPGYRYLYNTTFPQSGGAQPAGRATHSTDMLVLFNALAWTPAETALLFEVHGYLANVVRTRDPNAGAVMWCCATRVGHGS